MDDIAKDLNLWHVYRIKLWLSKSKPYQERYCPLNTQCYICRALFPEVERHRFNDCPCKLVDREIVIERAKELLRQRGV